MSKLKKSLYFIIPLVLVLAISLSFMPRSFGLEEDNERRPSFAGKSELGGQIAYAVDSTGASEAGSSEKGGAYYIGKGTTYTMTGGTITGKSKKYGGAVFVDSDATFIMSGGTITSCEAKYGGAIYVAAGGTCRIVGGTITNNKAENAPAIYVEEGGTLEVGEGAILEDNVIGYWLPISPIKEQIGGFYTNTYSSVILHTTTFGSYPQTYVGNDMNEQLETWFVSNEPIEEKTYRIRSNNFDTTGTWPAYKYTDGELYVRERSYRDEPNTYKNGEDIPEDGTYVWFKVEPIKWFIMNYEAWKSDEEEIELFSAIVLTSNIIFNSSTSQGNSWKTSEIRTWCNSKFYNDAFNEEEKELISLTTIKNNKTNDYANANSDGKAENTQDYIYLKSYYEMSSGIFAGNTDTGDGKVARICAPSDFALSNHAHLDNTLSTSYRGQGTSYYFLRSAGSGTARVCAVDNNGHISNLSSLVYDHYCIRPALRLSI